MKLTFTKLAGQRHEIVIRDRREGPALVLPARETGPTIPHDSVHAVVEQALRLPRGFWAAVDAGAMFEGMKLLEPQRHQRAGIKALRRMGDDTFPAELTVSWAHRVWSGQRTEGRGLGACPLTQQQLAIAGTALDVARARWDALAPDERLELTL